VLATHLSLQRLKPGRLPGFFTFFLLSLLLNPGHTEVATLEALAGLTGSELMRGLPDFRVQNDSQWTHFSTQTSEDSASFLEQRYSWNHLYSEIRGDGSSPNELDFSEGRHNMQLQLLLPWKLRLYTALQSTQSILLDKPSSIRSEDLNINSSTPLIETRLGLQHQLIRNISQSVQIGARASDFSEFRYAIVLPYLWMSYNYQKPVFQFHSALDYSNYQDTFTVAIHNQQHRIQLQSESEFLLRALNSKNAFTFKFSADYSWINYDDQDSYFVLSDSGRVFSWSATISNTIFSSTTAQQSQKNWNLGAHIQHTSKDRLMKAWAREKGPTYPFGRFRQTTSLLDAALLGEYQVHRIGAEPIQSITMQGGLQQSSVLIEPAGSYSRKYVLDFRQIPKSMSESLLNQFANETWMFGSHLDIDNFYLETQWNNHWKPWLRTELFLHQYLSQFSFFYERKHTESQLFLLYENTYYYDKLPDMLVYSMTPGGRLVLDRDHFEIEFGVSQWLPLWTDILQPGVTERRTSSSEEQSELTLKLSGLAQNPSLGSRQNINGGFACYSSLTWKW